MPNVLLEKGAVIPFDVTRPCIDTSNPCEMESCMLTVAFGAALTKMFGRRNYYLRSVSAGCYFTLDGHRYETTWPITGGKKVVRFDHTYRKFCSSRAFAKRNPDKHEAGLDAARAAIEPFSTKAIIHNRTKIAPKVSAARKAQINKTRREKAARDRKAAIAQAIKDKANGVPPPKVKPTPPRPRPDGSRQLSF